MRACWFLVCEQPKNLLRDTGSEEQRQGKEKGMSSASGSVKLEGTGERPFRVRTCSENTFEKSAGGVTSSAVKL